jgi:hypothetical protein
MTGRRNDFRVSPGEKLRCFGFQTGGSVLGRDCASRPLSYPGRLKLPLAPYTDSETRSVTEITTINEVRIALPTDKGRRGNVLLLSNSRSFRRAARVRRFSQTDRPGRAAFVERLPSSGSLSHQALPNPSSRSHRLPTKLNFLPPVQQRSRIPLQWSCQRKPIQVGK